MSREEFMSLLALTGISPKLFPIFSKLFPNFLNCYQISKTQCGKIQYTVEKNGVKKPWWNINSYDIRMLNHQKNKKFPDQILQKSTRGNWPSSKTHRIKKPTPLWKTNFLRCTTLPFNQKLFVNPEGGNKHFVFSQLR